MKYLYLGKIVNTHGIKGELRLLSNIDKKNLIFIPGRKIYIGNKYLEETINSYRHHKVFDMITLIGYNDINEVLKYKGQKVYINREDLKLNKDDYLLEDLLDCIVIYNGKSLGKIAEILYNNSNVLLRVIGEHNFYIPVKGDFLEKVNIDAKEIIVNNIEGLIL